ncbi:hypothetical protein GCM10027020_07330 [Nocardioides salsibiostraticola]
MPTTEQSAAPDRSTRPPGTIRLGSIAGADVLVSSSWFVIAALIAVIMAPRVEEVQPGLGSGKYAVGLMFAVVLYASVLLHEASHAFMARHYGYRVRSITLHFLGGMTAIENETVKPRQEFMIAVVGPLTSIAVGLVALGAFFVTPDGLWLLAVQALAGANLLVGVLNLIPGLPLDGGRVLKAIVWGASGDMHRGTIAAGWGGRITAIAVLMWPYLQERIFGVEPAIFDFVLVAVIGMFLWFGASSAINSAKVRSRLPQIVARDLARRTLSVPESLPLAEAVRRAQEAEAGSIVTTTTDGRPVGVVSEAAVLATPEERRPWVPVSSVARTLEDGLSLPVGIDGETLIQRITQRPSAEYVLVTSEGSVYGVLATADVDAAFRATR